MIKFEIDKTVWLSDYRGVREARVIAMSDGTSFEKARVVLQHGQDFTVIEKESRSVFESDREAYLSLAQEKQQAAVRCLSEAADLFKRAGIPIATEPQS